MILLYKAFCKSRTMPLLMYANSKVAKYRNKFLKKNKPIQTTQITPKVAKIPLDSTCWVIS